MLIDTMLAMIKGNLMKCDISDIRINKKRNTYRINFKYKKEFIGRRITSD